VNYPIQTRNQGEINQKHIISVCSLKTENFLIKFGSKSTEKLSICGCLIQNGSDTTLYARERIDKLQRQSNNLVLGAESPKPAQNDN
jgi:hypothetical protein